MEHAFTLDYAEVHLMPLHQTKPSLQLLALLLWLSLPPRHPPPHQPHTPPPPGLDGEAELPGAWLTVLRANHSSRTAHCLIGHYLCCQQWGRDMSGVYPSSPFVFVLSPSIQTLPCTDKDTTKAKFWSLSPFHVLNLWQKPHIIANLQCASITSLILVCALVRYAANILHWFEIVNHL